MDQRRSAYLSSDPRRKSICGLADFFERFSTQIVMRQASGKGITRSYCVGYFNPETIVFHRFIFGHKQTAACSAGDANQPQGATVQQSLRDGFFIPDAQPE